MRPPGYCSILCHTMHRDRKSTPSIQVYFIYIAGIKNNGDKALKEFGSAMDAKKWHIGRELQKRPQYVTQAIARKGASMPINSRTKPEA